MQTGGGGGWGGGVEFSLELKMRVEPEFQMRVEPTCSPPCISFSGVMLREMGVGVGGGES